MVASLDNLKKKHLKKLVISVSSIYIAFFGILVFALKPGVHATDITLRSVMLYR